MSVRSRRNMRFAIANLARGPSYDAEAAAYINAAGELFPAALNTLVLGIKAAGLWDNHVGSIKKAIGVPNLTASLVDLRNPAFTGTAVNNPTQSATAGWTLTGASSQYIDSGWAGGAANSKASLNSVHVGYRILSGGGGGQTAGARYINPNRLGYYLVSDGTQFFALNNAGVVIGGQATAVPGRYIGTRTAAAVEALYRNGASLATGTSSSVATPAGTQPIGCEIADGTPGRFFTGRISLWHAGAGVDATQQATLDTLFNAYATAAGEA